ncbi:MAG: biotin--[acetyl-CoA-carboxylase] ligase [Acidaminococcaceae bacterium]|nr:biotin--[acetyl-CoA-carboxylase] ligase [Acidaminococcaceae bacterium]MDD4722260.1 biotin--[acetyl-CoA-carboxylase] ligase [Acidaminococcaceae bacterium]
MNLDCSKNQIIIGKPLIYYEVLDSTNLKAQELAEKGAQEGTIVQADRQSAGKGRLGRKWESPPGSGLWFTIILRPKIDPEYGAQATLLSAVVLVEVLEKITGIKATIKWPNDILVGRKKICGILSEMHFNEEAINYMIIGIGLNVNMDQKDFTETLEDIATSVYLESGKKFAGNTLLEAFRVSLEKWYEIWVTEGFKKIRVQWLASSGTIGRVVKVKDNDREIFSGVTEGIDDYGCLLVRNEAGILQSFDFGEISIRY